MSAILPTLLYDTHFYGYHRVKRFSAIDPIVVGDSALYGLDVKALYGTLLQFRIQGESTNFDVHLFSSLPSFPYDYDVLEDFYFVTNISKHYDDSEIESVWFNTDSPQTTFLYLVVVNNGAVPMTPKWEIRYQRLTVAPVVFE